MRIYLFLLSVMVFISGCTSQTADVKSNSAAEFGPMEFDTGMEWNANPSFSPDDLKIVFETGFGIPDIYLLYMQTKKITKVIATEAEESNPAFSPDGNRIILSSEGNLVLINTDGTGLETLTETSEDYDPHFSPDGEKILFSSFRNGRSDLWVMDADGNNPINITDFWLATSGKFSPDGKKIAFVIGRPIEDTMYTSNEIAVINADGGGLKILTDQTTQSGSPSFTLDGKKIIFQSKLEGSVALGTGKMVIRMINIDGTELVQLKEKYNAVGTPQFSHDGKNLAYVTRQEPHLLVVKSTEDLVWEAVE